MNRKRIAGLIATAQHGTEHEAEIASARLAELVSSGKLTNEEIGDIARESTEGCAAPAVVAAEPWRSVIASAIAVAYRCRAFWRRGSLVFVGGDASQALASYMRAATEADVHAAASFRMVEARLPLQVPGALSYSPNLNKYFDLFGEVQQVEPRSRATREAAVLWMDLFRNAFAVAIASALVPRGDPVDVACPFLQEKPSVPVEIAHARDLQDKLGGDALRVARVAEQAERLGKAAGSRWRLQKRKMLMECVTCAEMEKTIAVELAEAKVSLKAAQADLAQALRDLAQAKAAKAGSSIDDLLFGKSAVAPSVILPGDCVDPACTCGGDPAYHAKLPSTPSIGSLLEVD